MYAPSSDHFPKRNSTTPPDPRLNALALWHKAEWLASGVDPELIARNVASLDDRWEINRFLNWHTDSRTAAGRKGHGSGWVCRGLDPLLHWEPMGWGCFKPDTPRANQDGKPLKYEHPKGEPTRAFFLDSPNFSWKAIQEDVTVPIVLCEGAKKAGALLSQGFAAVALPGIYSGYRKDKYKHHITSLIPDLEVLAQPGRVFYFCFDHDTKAKTIRNVNLAIVRTGKLLAQRGCQVRVIQLPGPEKGVDDFLVAKGVEPFTSLYRHALTLTEWQAIAFTGLSYEPQIRLHQRYLGELVMIPEQGFIAIRSAKGTGKTHSLKSMVRKVRRVLLIGHRTNLLRNLAQRLELAYYGDDGVNIETASKLAITFDSLYKLPTAIMTEQGFKALGYDLIIVDEIEQGCHHVANSATCRDTREKIITTLEFFIKNAKLVVVADADLSDLSVDYVAALRGGQEQPFIIVNDYRNGGRNVHWYTDKDEAALVTALMADIEAGGIPYVFTDSKDRAKMLAESLTLVFPNKKIKVLHGDNSGEQENIDFIENINAQVTAWDIVVTSPSMGTGVSIDQEHFTSIWGLCAGGSLAAAELSQGLARVRAHLPMHVWVSSQLVGGYRTTNPKVLREQALEKNRATGILLKIDPLTGVWGAVNDAYLQLWSGLSARRNASLNNLRQSLADLLEAEGHHLIPVLPAQDEKTEMYRELLTQTRQILKFRTAQSIAQALDLSEADVEILEARAERLSEAERHQLEKRRIRQGYGMEVTPELVMADNQGRLYKALCALDDLVSPTEVAQDHDIKDREWHTVITDHSHYSFKRQARLYLGLEKYLDPNREYGEEDLEELGERARARSLSIKGILNLTIPETASNTWILGQLLNQLGLKTISRKIGPRGAVKRYYRINSESWAFAQEFLAYRERRRESKKEGKEGGAVAPETVPVDRPAFSNTNKVETVAIVPVKAATKKSSRRGTGFGKQAQQGKSSGLPSVEQGQLLLPEPDYPLPELARREKKPLRTVPPKGFVQKSPSVPAEPQKAGELPPRERPSAIESEAQRVDWDGLKRAEEKKSKGEELFWYEDPPDDLNTGINLALE